MNHAPKGCFSSSNLIENSSSLCFYFFQFPSCRTGSDYLQMLRSRGMSFRDSRVNGIGPLTYLSRAFAASSRLDTRPESIYPPISCAPHRWGSYWASHTYSHVHFLEEGPTPNLSHQLLHYMDIVLRILLPNVSGTKTKAIGIG